MNDTPTIPTTTTTVAPPPADSSILTTWIAEHNDMHFPSSSSTTIPTVTASTT
jgi:hypothetical protein